MSFNKERLPRMFKHKGKAIKTATIPSTVNELLSRDDVRQMLAAIEKDAPEITDCIIVYKKRDGSSCWQGTEDTTAAQAVFMLESLKAYILRES